ncbi:MAG TPA: substrate-binding domain-containing protein [Acidimicrobiales bacterium]|nr:substrate-binding domain-containing protein [Acidimicrobiales bacterium]
MQSKTQRRLACLSIVLSLGLVAAACGGDDDDTASDTGDASGEAGAASGEVNVSGSSTVLPISTAAGEAFMAENGDATVNVDGPGTGDGFELFCNGETDISDASRPIDDEEAALCEENGVEYVELQVANDGMAVMTNPNNSVECLSFADLYALIGPESEGFSTWADAEPIASELGSSTEFPDATLDLTGPGTESGTYDSFVEVVLTPIAEERGVPEDEAEATRPDYDASPDDNVIIQNIESSDTSLGWVGFAYAEQAGEGVTEVPVAAEPDSDCVEPSAETIADGTYPLSRPLFIYVSSAAAEENGAVVPFVDFYLENLAEFVEGAGYVALPDEQVSEVITGWEGR